MSVVMTKDDMHSEGNPNHTGQLANRSEMKGAAGDTVSQPCRSNTKNGKGSREVDTGWALIDYSLDHRACMGGSQLEIIRPCYVQELYVRLTFSFSGMDQIFSSLFMSSRRAKP
jgi:hypothetical protein